MSFTVSVPPVVAGEVGGESMGTGLIASRIIDPTKPILPAEYVVPNFAARGYLTILAGPAGVGKSTLALQFAAEAGSVTAPALYLDIENGPAHLCRLSQAMSLDTRRVMLADMHGVRLNHPPTLAQITREILELDPAPLAARRVAGVPLVVLDSLRRFAPGLSENSSDEMAPYIADLSGLARDTGAAVVLIHHSSSKAEAPSMRGSSAIQDQCDMAFTLMPRGGAFRLAVADGKFRVGPEPGPVFYQRMTEPLRLEVTDAPSPTRDSSRATTCAQEVVEALGTDAMNRSTIAKSIGRKTSDGTVGRVLERLEAAGTIVKHKDRTYSLAN